MDQPFLQLLASASDKLRKEYERQQSLVIVPVGFWSFLPLYIEPGDEVGISLIFTPVSCVTRTEEALRREGVDCDGSPLAHADNGYISFNAMSQIPEPLRTETTPTGASSSNSHGGFKTALPTRSVIYPLSAELVKASDALPSNVGRSSMVHSLAYHFGLLNLRQSGKASATLDDEEDEIAELRRLLGGPDDASTPPSASSNVAIVRVPSPATRTQLQTYHSESYLDALLSTSHCHSADEEHGLLDDCPRFSLLPSYVAHLSGAVLHAARELAEGKYQVGIVWDGGRHHARKSRAAGFCYVNDAVLAILELKRPRRRGVPIQETFTVHEESSTPVIAHSDVAHGFGSRPEDIAKSTSANDTKRSHPSQLSSPTKRARTRTQLHRLSRIFYLDLDLHWGDGVEEAFSGTSSVLTVSIHNSSPGFYPCAPPPTSNTNTSSAYSLRLPLQPSLSSHTFTRMFNSCIVPLLHAYDPEAIVVQCGLDGLAGDRMNQWNLDLGCLLRAVQQVLTFADEKKAPVLLLGGGGYHHPNAARGWTALTALALGRVDAEQWEKYDSAEGINAATHIPTASPHWPEYAPTDTLDVAAGHRPDTLHTEEYLTDIEDIFKRHADTIRKDRR